MVGPTGVGSTTVTGSVVTSSVGITSSVAVGMTEEASIMMDRAATPS